MHAVPQPQQQQQVPSQLQQGGDGMDVDGAGGDVSRRESEGGLVPAGGATRANSGSSTGGTQGAGGAGADAAGGFDVSASLFRWPTEEGPRGTDGRTKLICRVSSLSIGSAVQFTKRKRWQSLLLTELTDTIVMALLPLSNGGAKVRLGLDLSRSAVRIGERRELSSSSPQPRVPGPWSNRSCTRPLG